MIKIHVLKFEIIVIVLQLGKFWHVIYVSEYVYCSSKWDNLNQVPQHLVLFPLLVQSWVRYRLMQAVKILTVRLGENLGIAVIKGEGTLNEADNDS